MRYSAHSLTKTCAADIIHIITACICSCSLNSISLFPSELHASHVYSPHRPCTNRRGMHVHTTWWLYLNGARTAHAPTTEGMHVDTIWWFHLNGTSCTPAISYRCMA